MNQAVFEALLLYVTKDNRVCPKPLVWNELCRMLPNKERQVSGWNPPLPLILNAYYETTDDEKISRLECHIHYAYEHSIIQKVDCFLRQLDKRDWIYRGEV